LGGTSIGLLLRQTPTILVPANVGMLTIRPRSIHTGLLLGGPTFPSVFPRPAPRRWFEWSPAHCRDVRGLVLPAGIVFNFELDLSAFRLSLADASQKSKCESRIRRKDSSSYSSSSWPKYRHQWYDFSSTTTYQSPVHALGSDDVRVVNKHLVQLRQFVRSDKAVSLAIRKPLHHTLKAA